VTEIIRPKFDRKRIHQIRLVRSKPQLAAHPDFENLKKGMPIVTSMTIFVFTLSCIFALFKTKDR
jgi:hypothetical protein